MVLWMGKQEVGWKLRLADGTRREVLARRVGGEWFFLERSRRYERWREIAEPSREDWDTLLDAIRRRYVRQGYSDKDVRDVERVIAERFPN
jgi:hypothetical protein